MTASTVKSTLITNMEANPIVVGPRTARGKVCNSHAVLAVATTSLDEIGDIILTAPVPSNARIRSIVIKNDALDSDNAVTADVGLYYSGLGHADATKTSGTVVDADCFATAITTLRAANSVGVDVVAERASKIADAAKEAWEVAGLTADPKGLLYVGITIAAAATSADAGALSVDVDYVV